MFKSNKDSSKNLRSLGPDAKNIGNINNISVSEVESRWPILKNTQPKKLDEIPSLSEADKENWIISKTIRNDSRKSALSFSSSTSKEKLAESLNKMSGFSLRSKKIIDTTMPEVNKKVEQSNILNQELPSAGMIKLAELKKKEQIRIADELNRRDANNLGNKYNSPSEANTSFVKTMGSNISNELENKNKSLRGIFNKFNDGNSTEKQTENVVNSSVLRRLVKK